MAYCNSTSFSIPADHGFIDPHSMQVFTFATPVLASAGFVTLLQVGLFFLNSTLPHLTIKLRGDAHQVTLFEKNQFDYDEFGIFQNLVFEDFGSDLNSSSVMHFWDSHKPKEGRLSSLSFKDSWTIEITNEGDERVFLDHANFKLGSKSTL